MSEDQSFRDLILQVRSGDVTAAAELVRRYEPTIRRTVRVRLRNFRLRRVLDSTDICQSVLANFFVRVAAGQYELETPDQLLKLLATIARNKVLDHARYEHRECRDQRRLEPGPVEDRFLAARDSTPSQHVAAQELLREARRRLTPDELHLLELRHQGREWADIAAEVGGSPEALRKQLARGVDRVAKQLGLDEVCDD
jgi:RNA polymerase sigma-70 factor (ECF subfamily)